MGIAFNSGKMELGLGANGPFISLDSPGEAAFFSHAHSDHISPRVQKVLASEQTIGLMKARGWKKKIELMGEGDWESSGVSFKLLEAGHVMGSRQLQASFDGESFVYTADLNPAGTLLCPPAQVPVGADSLLIESTFGKPEYKFPPMREVCQEVSNWVDTCSAAGSSVVLGGYALGKAQELVKLLNDYNGVAPIVNESVASVCREYNKHGSKLEFIDSSTSEGQVALGRSFVAVLPHHQVRPELARKLSEYCKRKVHTALATGWASSNRFAGVDKAFTLSSHADFETLVKFVEACSPKKVYCNHGFSEALSRELRVKGYDAVSVSHKGGASQKGLANFIAE